MIIPSTAQQKAQSLMLQIQETPEPNLSLVHQLLQSLHLFHIYDLERALTSPDPRVRNAALKKIEQYLPDLTNPDSLAQRNGILAMEHLFERIKMLDEDA